MALVVAGVSSLVGLRFVLTAGFDVTILLIGAAVVGAGLLAIAAMLYEAFFVTPLERRALACEREAEALEREHHALYRTDPLPPAGKPMQSRGKAFVNWRWSIPLLVPLIALLATSVLHSCDHYFGPAPVRSIGTVADYTALWFPEQARLLDGRVHQTLSSGGAVVAKISVPPSDLESFLSQSPFHSTVDRSRTSRDHFSARIPWDLAQTWRMDSIHRSLTAGGAFCEPPYVGVLVDLGRPSQPILYVWSYN
jgi:hypothetical protein